MVQLIKSFLLTLVSMKKVKGIGDKKVEKYGHHFLEQTVV
jgi:hypothetical protein